MHVLCRLPQACPVSRPCPRPRSLPASCLLTPSPPCGGASGKAGCIGCIVHGLGDRTGSGRAIGAPRRARREPARSAVLGPGVQSADQTRTPGLRPAQAMLPKLKEQPQRSPEPWGWQARHAMGTQSSRELGPCRHPSTLPKAELGSGEPGTHPGARPDRNGHSPGFPGQQVSPSASPAPGNEAASAASQVPGDHAPASRAHPAAEARAHGRHHPLPAPARARDCPREGHAVVDAERTRGVACAAAVAWSPVHPLSPAPQWPRRGKEGAQSRLTGNGSSDSLCRADGRRGGRRKARI